MLLLLLAACGGGSSDAEGSSDTPPDDSAPAEETGGSDTAIGETGEPCIGGDIIIFGDPIPGATLTLTASAEAEWSVSAGTLSATTGSTVEWTLPTDIAENQPEELTVTATTCGEESTVTIEADWPLAARTVVLYNPSVAGSEDVARAYADFRGIDAAARCGVPAVDSTTLAGADYPAFAEAVQACIDAVGPHVWFLVPVYGVPYKVTDRIPDIGGGGWYASVSLDAMLFYGGQGVDIHAAQYSPVYQDGDSTTTTYDDAKT